MQEELNKGKQKTTSLTEDLRTALGQLESQDAARDATLRTELDAMASKVSEGFDALNIRLEAVGLEAQAAGASARAATGQPTPPGFDPAALGEQARDNEHTLRSLLDRVHGLESTIGTHEGAIKNAQNRIDTVMAGAASGDPWHAGRAAAEARPTAEAAAAGAGGASPALPLDLPPLLQERVSVRSKAR